jgi:hypothetical protein
MTAGAFIVLTAVVILTSICVHADPDRRSQRRDAALIIGGGVIVPTIILTTLLVYGLAMLPPLVARAPEGTLQVSVVGEQWWWRVRYVPASGEPVELANEIRLPAGEPVQFQLARPASAPHERPRSRRWRCPRYASDAAPRAGTRPGAELAPILKETPKPRAILLDGFKESRVSNADRRLHRSRPEASHIDGSWRRIRGKEVRIEAQDTETCILADEWNR